MAINLITMKIYNFEEDSSSLIVSFKSDQSTKSIDDQPRMAFQPTMFEETDPDQVLTKILQAGVSIAETQDKQDALKQNTIAVDAYKAKVGQELTYVVPAPTAQDIQLN